MVRQHPRLSGHEFQQTPGDGSRQRSLACYSSWGHKESETSQRLNNNKNNNYTSVGYPLTSYNQKLLEGNDLCDITEMMQVLHNLQRIHDNYREGNGTPLQHSCLENPMDGGAWQATVHRVIKSWTRLSNFTFTSFLQHSVIDLSSHLKVEIITVIQFSHCLI